ncbi:DUF3247 family protein [Luteimonas huabeiensis]|uniref:DUF3247 family protein n=1 Tax=Luteimonas huabeiensis TaxID=1244513 RepID=UPI000466AB48|nr:DUF3247 family protein [Luteimonas huabeiensis]
MGQLAPRVHTDPDEIARLEALVAALHDEAVVEIELDDGGRVTGVVAVRPTVQTFRDPEGREGSNGVVRIDDALAPARAHMLWLDAIRRVRRLGTA